MKLATYLADRGIPFAAFADEIGVSNAAVVSRYVAGTRVPRKEIMKEIARVTGGAVQPNDFFEAA